MKVCFPVSANKGLQSEIYGHFSSAPLFLVVDSETRAIEEIENCDPENSFQGCNPVAALKDKGIGAIIVEGIADAVHQVMSDIHGYTFFDTTTNSLEQALQQLLDEKLKKIEPFYSQNEGRCGGDEEDSCDDHHHEEEEEAMEVCVNNGGSGCANHSTDPCSSH
jgi:predicted Fe-Mo cluster-binding NifX family protein